MSYHIDIQTHQMANIDQTFHNIIQRQEMDNEETYLIENKSNENVDYVFKDEMQSDIDDDLHEKSLLSTGSEYEADTNISTLIDEIEFTDGFFKRDLLPMLSKGHEGELCKYLQEIGVLKSSMRCTTEGCDAQSLTWTPSRVVDKYQWLCTNCKKRRSIRENSFFKGIKFIIPIVLRAMQGWCGNHDSSDLAQSMGLKSYAFRTIYAACRDVAARHMTELLSTELLGGSNTVVILDVWSSGVKGALVPIAALVELKDQKFKYFYQPLRYNQQFEGQMEKNNNVTSENNNTETPAAKKPKLSNDSGINMELSTELNESLNKSTQSIVKSRSSRSKQSRDLSGDLQSLIKQKVAPDSFLVLGEGIMKTAAETLLKTENMNAVKTLEMLKSVEKDNNPLSDIIGVIIQHPSQVISKAREIPRGQLQKFLMMHLWYDTYAQKGAQENTLETLLHQIAAEDFSTEKETEFTTDTMMRFID